MLPRETGVCVQVVNHEAASATVQLDLVDVITQNQFSPHVHEIIEGRVLPGGLHAASIMLTSKPGTSIDVSLLQPALQPSGCPFATLDTSSLGPFWLPPWYSVPVTDLALYDALLIYQACGANGLAEAGYVFTYAPVTLEPVFAMLLGVVHGGTPMTEQLQMAEDDGCVVYPSPTNLTSRIDCTLPAFYDLRLQMGQDYMLACDVSSCPFNNDNDDPDTP